MSRTFPAYDRGTTTWYVVTRPDNGYPLTIYPDKDRAEMMARVNGNEVVAVRKVEPEVDGRD